jgi:transcriptional regulator with XRE-family HTH domain
MASRRRLDPLIVALCAARYEAGLTQLQLQERSGIAASTLCYYESGRRSPTVPCLRRWAGALGYDIVLARREVE